MSTSADSVSVNAYAQGGGLVEFNPRNPSAPVVIEGMESIAARIAPPTAEAAPLASRVSEKAPAERQLEEALAAVADQVEVPPHRNLTLSDSVRLQLDAYNLEMRKIEKAKETRGPGDPLQRALTDRYNAVAAEKIVFVRANVRVEDQVYAMSIPRILEQGTPVFTANRSEKMQRILYTQGFSQFEDPTTPATFFAPGFVVTGAFSGGNEMGEIGHYFSKGTSNSYLNEDRIGLRCSLRADQEGTAIMSVSELRAAGFSPEQIEGGYKRLQKDYPFIQNDGLYPKDTEIVYINPQGNLRIDEIVTGAGERTIWWSGPTAEYWAMSDWGNSGEGDEKPEAAYHASWNGIEVRRAAPAAAATIVEAPAVLKTPTVLVEA